MQKNIQLYPWYFAASAFLAWMPVFFLYFNSYLDLSDVLLLEAIYYITVVILEVPSGYFSDALGRRRTLLLGAVFLCLAIVLYLCGKSFYPLVLGQIFFAGHISFVSGTNTVFHYESLKSINKEHEYGDREASVTKWSLIAAGIAALFGGWAASYHLSYAFLISLIGAIPALVITILFVEPEKSGEETASHNVVTQLKESIKYLRKAPLGWIFAFYVVMFTMVHVPYEFYQPYLNLLEQTGQLTFSSAPMMAGMLLAVSLFVSAFAAGRSIVWKNRVGLKAFLSILFIVMMVIIGLMSWILHPFIIVSILLRSFSSSAMRAPVNEIITPNIAAGQRATFHSMMSLACRLSFFVLLLVLSSVTPSEQVTDWVSLSRLLRICLVVGIVLAIPLFLTMKKMKLEDE